MHNKIEFNLVQNAIDSIEHAVDLLAFSKEVDNSTKHKRAILSISHGIELLLKERLRMIHPSLVWDNVDKYPNLEGRTVSSEKALHRLKHIGGIEISEDDERLLRSIKKTRNAIEHYTWSIENKEAEYIIGSALSFAIHFLETQLKTELWGYAARKDDTYYHLLNSNPVFSACQEKRYNLDRTTEAKKTDLCEFCKALISMSDNESCPKCGHWNSNSINKYSDAWDDEPF